MSFIEIRQPKISKISPKQKAQREWRMRKGQLRMAEMLLINIAKALNEDYLIIEMKIHLLNIANDLQATKEGVKIK